MDAPQKEKCRRLVALFCASVVLWAGAWAATVLALDVRYNTSPPMLARSGAFDAAIIGNSRIINVDPEILSERTRFSFASLATHAVWPTEQMVILRAFLRHQPAARAVVLGMDETWCMDPVLRSRPDVFTAGDYEEGLWRPVLQALRPHSTARTQIETRLRLLAGLEKVRLDGFKTYDPHYILAGQGQMEVVRPKFASERPTVPYVSLKSFPAADLMQRALLELPPQAAFVLVWPPTHISVVSVPGSAAAKAMTNCFDFFTALASQHPLATVVNWAGEHPVSFVDENFFDRVHYRANVGNQLSAEIADSILSLSTAMR